MLNNSWQLRGAYLVLGKCHVAGPGSSSFHVHAVSGRSYSASQITLDHHGKQIYDGLTCVTFIYMHE